MTIDELDLVARLRAVEPTAQEAFDRAKLILKAEMVTHHRESHELHVNPQRDHRPTRRRLLASFSAVAAGALVVAGVLLATGENAPPASAAQFLQKAASQVRNEHLVPSDLTQYQYIVSSTETADGQSTEDWTSTDGTQPGVVETLSTTNGVATVTNSQPIPVCTPPATPGGCFDIGSFPNMPTSIASLGTFFASEGILPSNPWEETDPTTWTPEMWAQFLPWILADTYLTPNQQAEMYTMLSEESGATLVPQAQNALGQTGVGVEWTTVYPADTQLGDITREYIFNPTTYAFMGLITTQSGEPTVSWAALPVTGSDSLPTT